MGTRNDVGKAICGHCGSTKTRWIRSRVINPYTERNVYICDDCDQETPIDTDSPP